MPPSAVISSAGYSFCDRRPDAFARTSFSWSPTLSAASMSLMSSRAPSRAAFAPLPDSTRLPKAKPRAPTMPDTTRVSMKKRPRCLRCPSRISSSPISIRSACGSARRTGAATAAAYPGGFDAYGDEPAYGEADGYGAADGLGAGCDGLGPPIAGGFGMPTGGGTEPPGTAAAPTVFFPRRALRSIFGFFCSDIESPRQDDWRRFLTGNARKRGAKVTAAHPFGKIEFECVRPRCLRDARQ